MLKMFPFQKNSGSQISTIGLALVLTCAFQVAHGTAQDEKNDRRLGNGRFFKNMREQFSRSEKDSEKSESRQSKDAQPNPAGNQNSAFYQNPNTSPNRPAMSGGRPSYPPKAGQPNRPTQVPNNGYQRNESPAINANSQVNRNLTVAQQRELHQRQLEYERAQQDLLAAERAYQQAAQQLNQPQQRFNPGRSQANQAIQSWNNTQQLGSPAERTPGNVMQPVSAKKRNQNSSGFGMRLKTDKSDTILIDALDRNGNADNAGLKRGDQVVAIGGVPIGSVEEFDEISQILGDGDQMEIKVQRRGKEIDVVLTYGEPIDSESGLDQSTAAELLPNSPGYLPAADRRQGIGSGVRSDFVPQADRYSLPPRSGGSQPQFEPRRTESRPGEPLRPYEIPTPPSQQQRSLHELNLDLKSNFDAQDFSTNRSSRRPNSILEID